jgi:predicted N-acetyltransferase YhbS
MIVPLLALPDWAPAAARAAALGVRVRRARAWEQSAVRAFVERCFTRGWADEVACAWARVPISAFLAVDEQEIVGFAAYDCAHLGVFGPTGVRPDRRGHGIGAALLLRCLHDMRARGYIYGIIGAVGPAAFYEKVCGAVPLPDHWPSYVTAEA